MSKYAIDVTEQNLDLIEALSGLRPEIEEEDNVFLLEISETGTEAEIGHRDNYYDESGHSIDSEIVWL